MLFPILFVVAVVLAGLSAGIFVSFSSGIMPGLRRSDDATFVRAMRDINVAVVNAVFLAPVFLSPLALAAAGIVSLVERATVGGVLLIVAAALALAGGVLLTGARNVPLNNRLAASTDDVAATRDAFERPWVRSNAVRSVLTVGAFVLAVASGVVV